MFATHHRNETIITNNEEENDFKSQEPIAYSKTINLYQNRNEFAIRLEKDENFRAITKVGESYTRFVDAYDQINDKIGA